MTDERKALIREYKQKAKEMGVYCIRNTVNNRCFVGFSTDIQARFNRHRQQLKYGSEPNPLLLADWREFGADSFVFETLELLEPLDKSGYNPREDLKVLESIWLEKLNPFVPDGYNKPRG
ncbi:MAG: GIY-YIG nuclease family protein [Pseudomonadota bacterium]